MNEADKQNVLLGVLASLHAQQKNLPSVSLLDEVYVQNYNEQLDELQHVGFSVDKFRIPPSQVQPQEIGSMVITAGEPLPPKRFTSEKYIAKSLLLTKIDTLLNYFNLQKETIGFRG